jgi:hypothetical protein
VGHGDLPLVFQDHDFPQFTVLPNSFSAGELGRVRVEIRDINPPQNDQIETIMLGCKDDPQCVAGSGCLLRATWTVQY